MKYPRQQKFQGIRRSARAQQFCSGLSDEIRFDSQINSLWVKYRFDVILPDNDFVKVIFTGNESNVEFKKLKDFILNFEQHWSFVPDPQ
jgi:hypothetical protein